MYPDDIKPLTQQIRQYGYLASWDFDADINTVNIIITCWDKYGNPFTQTIGATQEAVLEWLYDKGLIL